MGVRTLISLKPSLYGILFDEAADLELRSAVDASWNQEERNIPAAELAPLLADQEILITGWGSPRLDEEVLDQAGRLRLVVHSAGSVKGLVSPVLFDRGVRVVQAAAAMAPAVAEMCLTCCLVMLRHVHRMDRAMYHGGSWEKGQAGGLGRELRSCRIGVVGASRTGVEFIRMATALGAEVWVFDPYLTAERAAELGVRAVALRELLAGSDIVALHAPSTAQTQHMIGAEELALLRDGAILVNTARSWLTDEAALLAELNSGRINAALDVFDEEPLPFNSPFRGLDNVLLTPHQAGASVEARHRQGRIVVDEIVRFLAGEDLKHEVREDTLPILA